MLKNNIGWFWLEFANPMEYFQAYGAYKHKELKNAQPKTGFFSNYFVWVLEMFVGRGFLAFFMEEMLRNGELYNDSTVNWSYFVWHFIDLPSSIQPL